MGSFPATSHLAFTNENLLAEVSRKGAFGKFSSLVGLLGRGSSSLVSPLSKDEGFSKGRTKSLAPWKEQEVGFPTEGNGDVNKPLCVISDEDLIMESPKNQPEDAEWANQEVCSEEGNSGHGSSIRGLWVVEHLSDSSFRKFLIFSKFLGLPMDGNEKEIASLLRKMENRKGRRVSVVKRRPSSTPHFVRELRNLECSVNYCNSSKKERSWSSGWEMLCK